MRIKPLRSHFYRLCIYLTIEQQEMPIMVMELPSHSHLAKPCHMFQKANVTSNKMELKKHHFLVLFCMTFHMAWFVLFGLLAFRTIK